MEGYDKLAALMTGDIGLSIFRSFRRLNAKNLLYLQAEIVLKEIELKKIIDEDKNSKEFPREKFSSSVRFLKDGLPTAEQWVKFQQLRELLEKYNNALIQHSQLVRLKSPHERDLEVFRGWLEANTFCSTPAECYQWFGEKGENAKDLITTSGRYENVDPLTRWGFRVIIPYIHRLIGHRATGDIETGTVYYNDEKIIRVTRVISIITSSVIPASSMLVLYLVHDLVLRLIIIILYNIGFSVIIGLLAKARRVEVFAASTAFAAVQVAFITNFPRN